MRCIDCGELENHAPYCMYHAPDGWSESDSVCCAIICVLCCFFGISMCTYIRAIS